MNTRTVILFALIQLFLMSCDKSNQANDETAGYSPDQGAVLAVIDGQKIYQAQLDKVLVDMFGEYQAAMLGEEGRRKALESLVATRAIVKLAETTLDKEQLSDVEFKASQYRDNLLVNAYVRNNVTAEPVTQKMVEDYYNTHLEKYGQKVIREYQLLTTKQVISLDKRDAFIKAFDGTDKTNGIDHVNKRLTASGFEMNLQRARLGESVLSEKLEHFIKSQKVNELSKLIFIDQKPYIVMVTSESIQAAAPLNTVSDDIRKSLALLQLKKSIKGLSAEAVKQFNIEYK